MGNAIGRVTGRSPAYSAVLLFVLARYAAVRLRGPGRTAATPRRMSRRSRAAFEDARPRVSTGTSASSLVLLSSLLCFEKNRRGALHKQSVASTARVFAAGTRAAQARGCVDASSCVFDYCTLS